MRLLTYNIHKGVGTDRRYRLDRVVAVIAAESPDLVCLQEVDRNCRRSRRDDQPALLAERLGAEASLYQLNAPHGEGGYGNLLLSRWPFHEGGPPWRCIPAAHAARRPAGGGGHAGGAVAPGPRPLRPVGARAALAGGAAVDTPSSASRPDLPTLIAGDFNDWRNTLGKRCFLANGFHHATAPVRRFRTFPAFLPLAAIDKIYYRGALRVVETHVVAAGRPGGRRTICRWCATFIWRPAGRNESDQAYFLTAFSMALPAFARSSGTMTG